MPRTAEAGVVLSTYLSAPDAAILRARAQAAERTVAAELRLALRDYLNDNDPATTPGRVKESAGQGRHGTA